MDGRIDAVALERAVPECAAVAGRRHSVNHVCWWREGKDAYAEAQFFAQVARAYPVLSLGAAVEKGFTTAPEGVVVPREEMMTGEWDWHRVVPELDAILKEDVPAIADRLGDITLRIRVSTEGNDPTTGKPKRLWRWKAFTYSDRKCEFSDDVRCRPAGRPSSDSL